MVAKLPLCNRSRRWLTEGRWKNCRPRPSGTTRCWKTLWSGLGPQLNCLYLPWFFDHATQDSGDVWPQLVLDMFEDTVLEAGKQLVEEKAVWLLPLLSGEGQAAVLSLPAVFQGNFKDVWKTVLDCLGYSHKDQCCQFHNSRLGVGDQLLATPSWL